MELMWTSYSSLADLGGAAGLDHVLLGHGVEDVAGERGLWPAAGWGSRLIMIGALLAAVDVGDDRAGNGDELRAGRS